PVAEIEAVSVVAPPAIEPVVTGTADQDILGIAAGQGVIARSTGQRAAGNQILDEEKPHVVEGRAVAVDRPHAAERKAVVAFDGNQLEALGPVVAIVLRDRQDQFAIPVNLESS